MIVHYVKLDFGSSNIKTKTKLPNKYVHQRPFIFGMLAILISDITWLERCMYNAHGW